MTSQSYKSVFKLNLFYFIKWSKNTRCIRFNIVIWVMLRSMHLKLYMSVSNSYSNLTNLFAIIDNVAYGTSFTVNISLTSTTHQLQKHLHFLHFANNLRNFTVSLSSARTIAWLSLRNITFKIIRVAWHNYA